MDLKKIMIGSAAVVLGLVGLNSCPNSKNRVTRGMNDFKYFAEIPMVERGMALTSSDYDGDGDVDIIVGARKVGIGGVRLYLFLNDGKGNFYNPREKGSGESQ